MSTAHASIEDPLLGGLHRAETTLDDGGVVTHDWYAGALTVHEHEIELMIDGADDAAVQALLPRVHALIADLDRFRRHASDAVVARFSDHTPAASDLDAAADDLVLDTIETTADSTVLHFTDSCGEHFPEGFWPAVHLDLDGEVTDITVEG